MQFKQGNMANSFFLATRAKELGADQTKLNVCGGAMALGHPLGATGKAHWHLFQHYIHNTLARWQYYIYTALTLWLQCAACHKTLLGSIHDCGTNAMDLQKSIVCYINPT
jgi:hypothetical protein